MAVLGGAVVRIDPTTNKVQATIKIPANASACGGFAISDQAVWMDSCADQTFVVRIDPSTNQVVATVDLGGLGGPPILIDGAPWVLVEKTDSGSDPARLVRINPATNLIDQVFSLGATFRSDRLLLAFGSVWTTDWLHDQVLRCRWRVQDVINARVCGGSTGLAVTGRPSGSGKEWLRR